MGAIDFSKVTLDQLNKVHFEREFWYWITLNYRLLYRGGEEFLRAAGQTTSTRAQGAQTQTSPILDLMSSRNRRRRFLFQLEQEPDTKYISRWERAYYIGYMGAIIDYFRHWQFSQAPEIRPVDTETPPDWQEPFMANANGSGQKLLDFVKDVFGDVLQVRLCGWLIGRPQDSIGDTVEDAISDAPVVLTPYPFEDIMDWQDDDCGELKWILLRKETRVREFPEDRKRVEIRTYVDRTSWAAWEVTKSDGGDIVALIDSGDHNIGKVPFVRLEIPHGLWPANKLATWQINLFNQMSMLDYGQLVACFPQPTLKTATPGEANHVFGEGILLELRAADGQRAGEEFAWVTMDPACLDFSSKRILEQRDEGYRIVHQMSLAVDSQAIGAIARSGASKIEDRRSSEIIMCAYGGYIRDALIRTFNLISEIVGDKTKWYCDGFDNFQVSSLMEELQTAALVSTFGFWSKTAEGELHKQVETGRVLGHIDERIKNKIRQEIDDKTQQDQEAAMAPQMMPDGTIVGGKGPGVAPAAIGMPPQPPVVNPQQPPGPRMQVKVSQPLGKGKAA